MKTIFIFDDGETSEEFILEFDGMPSMRDLNAAGSKKWGYKYLSLTMTSMRTE